MAVLPMWKCDRDNSMFDNKKEADAYDKMLELGEHFSMLLEKIIPQVDEKAAEEFGLVLARNKELVLQACKGRPEAIAEIFKEKESDNVTKLKAS
jgi:dsDNA-binding SOS-regulon protein